MGGDIFVEQFDAAGKSHQPHTSITAGVFDCFAPPASHSGWVQRKMSSGVAASLSLSCSTSLWMGHWQYLDVVLLATSVGIRAAE